MKSEFWHVRSWWRCDIPNFLKTQRYIWKLSAMGYPICCVRNRQFEQSCNILQRISSILNHIHWPNHLIVSREQLEIIAKFQTPSCSVIKSKTFDVLQIWNCTDGKLRWITSQKIWCGRYPMYVGCIEWQFNLKESYLCGWNFKSQDGQYLMLPKIEQ